MATILLRVYELPFIKNNNYVSDFYEKKKKITITITINIDFHI